MWCLVSQPNAVILEVEVDPKAKGQDCLEKVCHSLGISHETDYFGLKYHNQKGEELWLNLRNPIERQVGGVPPFRFALRVKFWVPPHLILQEIARHQFYLNARVELLEGSIRPSDWNVAARLTALIAQAEYGDVSDDTGNHTFYSQTIQLCKSTDAFSPAECIRSVYAEHCNLVGMRAATAEYWVLKEVSNICGWGEELFQTRLLCGSQGPCLGVGPHGLTVYKQSKSEDKMSIPYSAIVSTASNRRQFHLCYLALDGKEHTIDVKLDSSQAASGIYRAITEKHAFYSCETVRDAVTTQFIRDLKGTIASIFKEDSTLGVKYVFDIRRTCREVYDNARRVHYLSCPQKVEDKLCDDTPSEPAQSFSPRSGVYCSQRKCEDSRERLSHLLEAMLCRICMDRSIDTAFFPCAHLICCSDCAKRCEKCPLCRANISQAKHIFLPLELSLPLSASSADLPNSTLKPISRMHPVH